MIFASWRTLSFILPIFWLSQCHEFTGKLEEKLNGKFSIVHVTKKRLVKRGALKTDQSSYNRIEELVFHALDRSWRLFLTPRKGLLDRNFRAVAEDSIQRRSHLIPVGPEDFFEGHVFGAVNSIVSAVFDDEGALTASIRADEDAFELEPAWRHISGLPLNASIAYRHTDLVSDLTDKSHKFCGHVQLNASAVNSDEFREGNSEKLKRNKRESSGARPKNRCPIKLVADHHFYKKIGRQNEAEAAKYLINLLDKVNTIYLNTDWGGGVRDQGMIVKEVVIHTTATPVGHFEKPHYNMHQPPISVSGKREWNVNTLLSLFSRVEGSKEVCLAHLFTAQSFQLGVLGMGYIGSPGIGDPGGLCSGAMRSAEDPQQFIFHNTALSSAVSTLGDTVVTREAEIVAAHEFGHNWGSPHDATPECMPKSRDGGSYIMYTYSVSGYDKNNYEFSPCSKASIKQVIQNKAPFCFQSHEDEFCGNQVVEGLDEECDAGRLTDEQQDPCCDSRCRLKANARCSPKNSACCTENCQFKRRGDVCRKRNNFTCTDDAKCSGLDAVCPNALKLPDNTTCLAKGQCLNGSCASFCVLDGKLPCICENVNESCLYCCRVKGLECVPYVFPTTGRTDVMPDGTRCIEGTCKRGSCERGSQDVVEHLWKIIKKIDKNNFWRFIKSNLVLVIVVTTMLVWIPASCLVHYVDKQMKNDSRQQYDSVGNGGVLRDHIEVVREVKNVAFQNNNPWSVAQL